MSKLRWQCRRGTLELDIMLERYLTASFESAAINEQQAFIHLLALEDTDLLSFLMGDRKPKSEMLAKVIIKIRALAAQ